MAGYARAFLGPRTWAQSSLKYGLVAVGDSGAVLTSSDGITWTPQTSGNSDLWSSVDFSPSLRRFCAVSITGTTMYSDDLGVTWNYGSVPVANQWSSIRWSEAKSMFVAVSQTGTTSTNRVIYSSDGITFHQGTSASDGIDNYSWQCIEYSPDLGIFCAVSANGTSSHPFVQSMTSSDGMTFVLGNQVIGETTLEGWSGVKWSKTLLKFCAVNSSGLTNGSMLSPDGVNWTPATQGASGRVCWSESQGMFVAVGGNVIKTSTDGASWATQTNPAGTHQGILWSDKLTLFVGVGLDGASPNLSSPPPATTWTARATGGVHTRAVCEGLV